MPILYSHWILLTVLQAWPYLYHSKFLFVCQSFAVAHWDFFQQKLVQWQSLLLLYHLLMLCILWNTVQKKPVTTMLTYPWKCTVLHCNHLGNTWKPLVLMTRHFDYCPSASEGDNQSVWSSAPVVSRCFPGGYNVKLYISRGRLAWWLLAFLHSVHLAVFLTTTQPCIRTKLSQNSTCCNSWYSKESFNQIEHT